MAIVYPDLIAALSNLDLLLKSALGALAEAAYLITIYLSTDI